VCAGRFSGRHTHSSPESAGPLGDRVVVRLEEREPDVLERREHDTDRHADAHLLSRAVDAVRDQPEPGLLGQFHDRDDVGLGASLGAPALPVDGEGGDRPPAARLLGADLAGTAVPTIRNRRVKLNQASTAPGHQQAPGLASSSTYAVGWVTMILSHQARRWPDQRLDAVDTGHS
jgi:hypothetical protein